MKIGIAGLGDMGAALVDGAVLGSPQTADEAACERVQPALDLTAARAQGLEREDFAALFYALAHMAGIG